MTNNEVNNENRLNFDFDIVGAHFFGYDSKQNEMTYGKGKVFKWNENVQFIDIPLVNENVKTKKSEAKSTKTANKKKKTIKSDDEMTH